MRGDFFGSNQPEVALEKYELTVSRIIKGRGAYICPNLECLEKAKKSKGLERSFKTPVPAEVYEKLREELFKCRWRTINFYRFWGCAKEQANLFQVSFHVKKH